MAIAEVILRIRDESSKTIQQLTATSEGYDATLRQVATAVAAEEAAERSRAAALGVTVAQMDRINAELKKQAAAESTPPGASDAIKDVAEATESLGKANWQTVMGAQSLKKNIGDVIQSILAGQSPMQVFMQQSEGVASALALGESPAAVLKQALGGVFSLITTNAATLGTLTVALGVAAVAYRVYGQEADRVYRNRAFDKDVTESLRGSELALRDALLEEDVALGKLSKSEGDILKIRYAIQDQARGYAEKNQEKIDALNEEIEASKKYITIQHGVAAAAVLAYDLTIGIMLTKARAVREGVDISDILMRDTLSVNAMIESVTGLESGTQDAKGQIQALTNATNQNAKSLGEARDAEIAATNAKAGHAAAAGFLKDQVKAYFESEAAEIQQLRDMLDELRTSWEQAAAGVAVYADSTAVVDGLLGKKSSHLDDVNKKLTALMEAYANGTIAQDAFTKSWNLLVDSARPIAISVDTREAMAAYKAGIEAHNKAEADAVDLVRKYAGDERTIYEKLSDDKQKALDDYNEAARKAGLDQQQIAADTAAIEIAAAEKVKAAKLAGVSGTITNAAGAVSGGVSGVMGVVSQSGPVGAIIAAVFQLVQGIEGGLLDAMHQEVMGFITHLGGLGAQIGDFIKESITEGIPALVKAIPELITGIVDALPEILSTLTDVDFWMGVAESIGASFGSITGTIIDLLIRGIPQMAAKFIETLLDPKTWEAIAKGIVEAFADMWRSIFDTFKGGDKKDKNNHDKSGGSKALVGSFDTGSDYIQRDGLAMVHQGEIVIPRHGIAQSAAMEKMGGGRSVVVNLNGVVASDMAALARQIRDAVRQGESFGI